MNDFNQDMQNLLNAYDSNWDDYLVLRKQFIEKYSLSVEKLQEIRVEELKDFNSKILQAELKNQKLQKKLNTAKKALTEIYLDENETIIDPVFLFHQSQRIAERALKDLGENNEI